MGNYDKHKFKTRIINIMKKNSPEDSVKIISKLKNPYTDEIIGHKKAIRIYVVNVKNIVEYDSEKYANNISKYNSLINEKINKICNLI